VVSGGAFALTAGESAEERKKKTGGNWGHGKQKAAHTIRSDTERNSKSAFNGEQNGKKRTDP